MTPVVLTGIVTALATAAVLLVTCISAALENPTSRHSPSQTPLSEVLTKGS